MLLAGCLAVRLDAAPRRPRPDAGPAAPSGVVRPGGRLALDLARRLLERRAGVAAEGRGLLLSQLAGILGDGLGEGDLSRALASADPPRTLPLAPELERDLATLLAKPFTDEQVLVRVEALGARLGGMLAFLHAENDGFQPYRVLLGGSFAEARLGPEDRLEVWIDAGWSPPGTRRSRGADETSADVLSQVLRRYAAAEGLTVRRYGATARFLDQHRERSVDLGLGLDLLGEPSRKLRERYLEVLKAHGILALASGRVLAQTPIRPGGDYVERHVAELARRFDLMREVLAAPLERAMAAGPTRPQARDEALQELDAAVGRMGSYLAAWRRNLVILEDMARGKARSETAARLQAPAAQVEDAARLLAARLRPDRVASYARATSSPLARLVADLVVRLEGYAARYRQALLATR